MSIFQRIHRCFGTDNGISSCDMFCQSGRLYGIFRTVLGCNCYTFWYVDMIKYSVTAFSNSNVNNFCSIKNSSEVIEKLRLRNYQGCQVLVPSTFPLYTPHCHIMILS